MRLSISVGEWWRHESYDDRHALCLDVTPKDKSWRMTLREPIYSPQQNFAKFGVWLSPKTEPHNPLIREIMEVGDFIVAHDPAVLSYITGRRTDYTGRNVQPIAEN